MLSFLSRLRSNKSKDKNVSDAKDTKGSEPTAPTPPENTGPDPVTKPNEEVQPSTTQEPSQSTSAKAKKKKTKKKSTNTTKGKGKKKNKSKKPKTDQQPKKNGKETKSVDKPRNTKQSKARDKKQPKIKASKTQTNKKKKAKQKAPKEKPQPKVKKLSKDKKSQNIQKSIAKKEKKDKNNRQKLKKEPNHKKQQKVAKNYKKSEKNKKEPKQKKHSRAKTQVPKPQKAPQKKKKERTVSQVKPSKHIKTKSQVTPQRKKKVSVPNKKQKANKSATNKAKTKENKNKKSKDSSKPKATKATKSRTTSAAVQSNATQKHISKKKKKQKERRNSHRQKDIATAKRRLSKRLSIKELNAIELNGHGTQTSSGSGSPMRDDTNDIWSAYLRKFCNEPQTASELHTFAKTDSQYTVLNYKECRIIFNEQTTSNESEPRKGLTHKTKEDRDEIYMKRDIKLAKKRRSHIITVKQLTIMNNDLKDETDDDGVDRDGEESGGRLIVGRLDPSQRRSHSQSWNRDPTSWMTHEPDAEDKSSVELIKENIKAKKQMYLASLADVNSLEKKKEIGKLFEKHIEHAKVNNITSNGEVDEGGGATNSSAAKKLFERLKDEETAMKNAVSIVKDLGFFKYICEDEIYSKIYIKRGQIGMDDDETEEADDNEHDFDLFDMNNIDILSKFEENKRKVLSNVICKAMVSMPKIEIIEMCNADVNDEFMEIFVAYMKEYYMKGKQPKITILSLQSNPISDRGMVSLIELIEMNHSVLNTIKLQNNRKDISTAVCQQMCESLEQNEFIIKFEFVFRHYQWRDFRDRVVKRNAEKARIQRLELQKSMSF